MLARTITSVLFAAGLSAGGLGITAASASHHPPGPDRCWTWHHHHWVWVCPRPYSPYHPELSFYFGFDDDHHHHHHHNDGDWKKKGDLMGDSWKDQNDNHDMQGSDDWKKKKWDNQ